ncbi:tyrosine-protein phosphatase [Muriicola soli]|uniref:protein-tyrosine-phosphatase n=1 Tax=Muriicola soli TaxID=2507538 RepID=A0A411ECW4_9FLAO|nr:CpsB/CapC family capsule biosynthesis tyrosine phosphatase [Muriicola soli]QBA65586.1 histidinol phosphatase [Muriicola soli]
MFHIFLKKNFLIDHLKGFVDIHNHILPGIDDGAKTVEESMALIKEFELFGVTNFIATPHIMNDYYPNTPKTIENALTRLKSELLRKGQKHIALAAAAEHMIDGSFEKLLQEGKTMPLPSNYLLVEMSYLQPAINFKSAIVKCAQAGYFTILAHPERYVYLHQTPQVFAAYKDLGIKFQLNLLSLGNYYGRSVSRTAYDLLEKDAYEFLGTDVHSLRHIKALKEIQISTKSLQKILPLINRNIDNFY